MNFDQIAKQLTVWSSSIPSSFQKDLVNKALRRVYDSHNWGFFVAEVLMTAPKMLTGSITFTQYANTCVVPAGALKTALDAITPDKVPIEDRQLRVEPGNIAPRVVYNITNYDSATGIITLDQPYLEIDGPAEAKIFKAFYSNPQRLINGNYVSDFKQYLYVVDLKDQTRLNLNVSLEMLNKKNAARTAYSSLPFIFAPHHVDPISGLVYRELYPYYQDTVNDKVYKVIYQRGGLDFEADEDSLPFYINSELLIAAAKVTMCEWANFNKGNNPALQKTNWVLEKQSLLDPKNPFGYAALLVQAMRNDEMIFPLSNIEIYVDYAMRGDFGDITPYAYEDWNNPGFNWDHDYLLSHD